jgi:hypothetical protein
MTTTMITGVFGTNTLFSSFPIDHSSSEGLDINSSGVHKLSHIWGTSDSSFDFCYKY